MVRTPVTIPKFIGTCDAEVVRKGELQPCDRTAHNLRYCEENGQWYPTCNYHTMRGADGALPASLEDIVEAVRAGRYE